MKQIKLLTAIFVLIFVVQVSAKDKEQKPQTVFIGAGVIDGDTFDASNGERVRVLNINTPELGGEAGKRAYYYARRLLRGKKVQLVKEPGKELGRYKRHLYHVILPDGSNYATKVIRRGHSKYWKKYGRTVLYEAEFKKAEKEAKRYKRGMWKNWKPKLKKKKKKAKRSKSR